MKSTIFIIRPWNIDFFLELEKEILENEPTKIIRWTMQYEVFVYFQNKNKDVIYLPDVFDLTLIDNGLKFFIENEFIKNFNFGVNFIHEIERFKSENKFQDDFIWKHIQWLYDNIPNNSTLISLSCDHFAYVVAAYLNLIKKGNNYLSQPIGFLDNANVLTSTPWNLNYFNNKELDLKYFIDYKESLNLPPSETIHYMRGQSRPKIVESLKYRIKNIFNKPKSKNRFQYLEKKRITKFSSFQRKGIIVKIDYVDLEEILEKDTKVFYFPLQFEPEMSILAYSPFYKNQLEVIRLISQSMNYRDVLVLKENPKMLGKRTKSFYSEINKYYNVKWLNPAENSREIIKQSYKVISITGTASIEAAALGVNSMIFGYPPFHKLLKQKPISEVPLKDFREHLYLKFNEKEIEEHLLKHWGKFSKAVFFGDFIPRFDGKRHTTLNTKKLAHDFHDLVLKGIE